MWAPTAASYCPRRIVELPKLIATECTRTQGAEPPCSSRLGADWRGIGHGMSASANNEYTTVYSGALRLIWKVTERSGSSDHSIQTVLAQEMGRWGKNKRAPVKVRDEMTEVADDRQTQETRWGKVRWRKKEGIENTRIECRLWLRVTWTALPPFFIFIQKGG